MMESKWLTCKEPRDMLAALNLLHYQETTAFTRPKPLISPRKAWLLFFAMDRHDLTFATETDDWEELEQRRLILAKCEAGERFADGLCTAEDVWWARHPDWVMSDGLAPDPYASVRESVCSPGDWLPGAAEGVCDLFREIVGNPFRPAGNLFARILKPDGATEGYAVGGRPVRRMKESPHLYEFADYCPWLTNAVLSLASAAYLDRLPDGTMDPLTLLALADALEEAGCDGEKCQTCDGRGVITQEHPWGDIWATERLTCPDCGGRLGRVPHPILSHLRGDGPHVRGCWAVDTVLGKE